MRHRANCQRKSPPQKKEVKKERKSLRATIAFLATAETPAAEKFRSFLGMKKGANKQARESARIWVESHYLYAATEITTTSNADGTEITSVTKRLIPASANGKVRTDFLDVITDMVKAYEVNTSRRNYIAKQAIATRRTLIGNGNYAERTTNVLNYIKHNAPAKIRTTITDTVVIVRK